MRKIILTSFASPGDIVMLTAAVRDLHGANPGKFLTDIRTSADAIWENNPFVTKLGEHDRDIERIDCHYPLINRSNQLPRHFVEGYHVFLEEKLGVRIPITAHKGDIYISGNERRWFSRIREMAGVDLPFWIIVAGGKTDFTAKWWIDDRWQAVVDAFYGRILFVQCGDTGPSHHHPLLRNAVDLRGKTDIRQLIRLVYHCQGIVCPVTFAMHLAAAVPMKSAPPLNRPCVVIAGGREPTAWEMYPNHRFLNTNGCLPCCDNGGCWKSRTVPLNDNDEKDRSLCVDVVEVSQTKVQHCMEIIRVEDVIRAIEMYFIGNVCRYLASEERAIALKLTGC